MSGPVIPILLVDAILALVVVEAVALVLLWRVRGIGIAPARLLPNLAAGACLLLTLRSVVAGAGWPTAALWLGLALVAHLADLAARWAAGRRGGEKLPPS